MLSLGERKWLLISVLPLTSAQPGACEFDVPLHCDTCDFCSTFPFQTWEVTEGMGTTVFHILKEQFKAHRVSYLQPVWESVSLLWHPSLAGMMTEAKQISDGKAVEMCLRRSTQRSWERGVAGDIFCPITEMARQTKQLTTNEDRPAGWHSRVLLPRLASIIGHKYLLRCCRVAACTCRAKFWGCSFG